MILTNDKKEKTPAKRRLAQWRVTWLIEHSITHQLLWCFDSFCSEIRHCVKRQIVVQHAIERQFVY
jgi:hypothetical protein